MALPFIELFVLFVEILHQIIMFVWIKYTVYHYVEEIVKKIDNKLLNKLRVVERTVCHFYWLRCFNCNVFHVMHFSIKLQI